MGSIYHPYQLTNKFESFTKLGKQTGVLFYIPAQNTSKIDPSTGFINKLYPKYESITKSQEFFRKFNDIRFNENKNYFEFDLDYRKFIKGFKTKPDWTICTYGIRLVNQRNPHKNNMWDTFEHDLTNELKNLFGEYRIDYCSHLQKQIVEMNDKAFFERLMQILKWTLQMRNSRTGSMEDSIVSPVVDGKGNIFVSGKDDYLPLDADANGAYNIARKGLICVQKIKEIEDDKLGKVKYKISLDDFLDFVQNHE